MQDHLGFDVNPNVSPQLTNRRLVAKGPDFYPTPVWATQALIDHESFEGNISEPACGDGAMAQVLIESGMEVISSDLYERDFGRSGIDFLKNSQIYDNIITNPPYSLVSEFVLHAVQHTTKKVAFLLRLSFLEGAKRQKKIFQKTPLARIWVFSERVTMYPKGEERNSGGTIAMAWFVWDHVYDDIPDGPLIKWISLGRKPNSRQSHKPLPNKGLTLADLR